MIGDRELSALRAVLEFRGESWALKDRISALERAVAGALGAEVVARTAPLGVVPDLLRGALLVKALANQVAVVIHALGILAALPRVMEPGERVVSLSLGAGTGGRPWDLETDRRIAEFKFLNWKRTGNSVRENGIFVDVYHLAEAQTDRRRVLYLSGGDRARRFLAGGRSIASVLNGHGSVQAEFARRHGQRFSRVRDYWESVRHKVDVVDLEPIVPGVAGFDAP